MHPGSISAQTREELSNNLRNAASLDPLVDSRLRYNAAELRGLLKHTSCQTMDTCVDTIFLRLDQASQVDGLDISSLEFDSHLAELRSTLEAERCRYQQREKLLISQMNALRDAESTIMSDVKIGLSISAKALEFDLSAIPESYDRILWSISCLELGRDDRVLAVGNSNSTIRNKRFLEITTEPVELRVPRSAGQVSLFFRFLARSSGQSNANFPLIIGEWSSPLFIPCLKDLGSIESFQVLIDEVGIASFDLVFR